MAEGVDVYNHRGSRTRATSQAFNSIGKSVAEARRCMTAIAARDSGERRPAIHKLNRCGLGFPSRVGRRQFGNL